MPVARAFPRSARRALLRALISANIAAACGPAHAQAGAASPAPAFDTEGLPQAGIARAFEAGRADVISDRMGTRLGLAFQLLLDGYLTGYGLKCSRFLPKDRVEWTIPYCSQSNRNRKGEYECVRHDEVHTKIFTDKNISEMRKKLMAEVVVNEGLTLSTSPSFFDEVAERLEKLGDDRIRNVYAGYWVTGMGLAVKNSCLSPTLRRFQENMVRFATEQPMLSTTVPPTTPVDESDRYSPPLPTGLPALKLNYERIDFIRFMNDVLAKANPGAGLPGSLDPQAFHLDSTSRDAAGLPSTVSVSRTQPNGYVFHVYLFFRQGRPLAVSVTPDGSRGTQFVSDELRNRFESGAYSSTETAP